MFCIHDWHNHRSTYKSVRADLLSDFPETPFPMLAVIAMGGLYAIPGGLLFEPTGMLMTIVAAMAIMTVFLCKNTKDDKDPWAVSDRTCLKCGKIQFNLTKRDEKEAVKEQAELAKNTRRRELSDAANEAFEKRTKLRRMAKA